MYRLLAGLVVAVCAAALAAGAAVATAATVHCRAGSIGPGPGRHGGTAGAHCLLSAYHHHCHAADYVLSSFGVDTVRQETFQLAILSRRCRIVVTETFRVVPRKPQVVRRRTCKRLHAAGSDVVAYRCSGDPRATISLTKID